MSSSLPEVRRTVATEKSRATAAVGNWLVHQYAHVTSTNLVAAPLPPWHAVRADVQTAGRGRFEREWISNEGGLWLSAVVPWTGSSGPGALLPLAAGLAIFEALRSLGIHQLRMRWPNDIMVQNAKLAGLLIDQFSPGSAVVGLGLNVTNRPEEGDPALVGRAIRLADLVTPAPGLHEVMREVLRQLESVCLEWARVGAEGFLPRINSLWQVPSTVELTLDNRLTTGLFQGVDSEGRLRLHTHAGHIDSYEPHQVRHLREL